MERHLKIAKKRSKNAKFAEVSKAATIAFQDKEAFSDLHEKLIELKIVDGSQDTIVKDLMDTPVSDAFKLVLNLISVVGNFKQVKILVYLALAGFSKSLISIHLRGKLKQHKNECQAAYNKGKVSVASKIVKEKDLTEDQLKSVLISRINAINLVLSFKGDRFLKRSIYVMPEFKLSIKDIKG